MREALVCGAGGFIGSHLVKKLKKMGYWVRGVDLKRPEFSETEADEFIQLDLREQENCERAVISPKGRPFDEVYQLARFDQHTHDPFQRQSRSEKVFFFILCVCLQGYGSE